MSRTGDRERWTIGKWKDMPADFRPAFEKIPGAIPDVLYQNGRFYKVINVNVHPLSWPEPVKIPLDGDDALVMGQDWGVRGELLGAFVDRLAEGGEHE